MQFLKLEGQNLVVENLFNEEHTGELLNQVQGPIQSISFRNVGVKIMRQILNFLEQANITQVVIQYNWNTIMTTPQLVCYDKNQWKTLQQLNNWNREWNELFSSCFALKNVNLKIECSWMDDQFAKLLLQGVLKIPNIQFVKVSLSSKNQSVGNILSAISQAKLFSQFQHEFVQLK